MTVRFECTYESPAGGRTGLLETPHGAVSTPAFMAVGTRASVKGMPPFLLEEAGASIVLANSFHLALRPGSDRIRKLGGLHRFMGWKGPILTDSGGYQVFSLADLRSVNEEGIHFRSPVDGEKLFLTPERAVALQEAMGVDIAMALDELVPGRAAKEEVERAMERSTRWARRCKAAWRREGTSLFGIVQGGVFLDLRARSIAELAELDLPGYGVGGLCVGEGKAAFRETAAFTAGLMPANKPRYLMGVGTPLDLVDASMWGYDLFDCVLPTRHARTGSLFTSFGEVTIKNSAFIADPEPLDPGCRCWVCGNVSRAYLNHLFRANDPTGLVLNTLHNLTYYFDLMARIRKAISTDSLSLLRAEVEEAYSGGSADIAG